MEALFKIEIDLSLDESMVSHVLERARKLYRATGSAVRRNEDRDVIVSAEGFIEGRTTRCWSCRTRASAGAYQRLNSVLCVAKREPEPIR